MSARTATGGRAARPLVKVCGLTRERDVRLCLKLGVDCTGFVFVPESPRYVEPEVVADFPMGLAARVGVFAGQSIEEVLRIMDQARLDMAQLHGGEDVDFCRAVGPERIIKVLWPENPPDGQKPGRTAADALYQECLCFANACACFLFDAGLSGGGSGRGLPSRLFAGFRSPRPWFLAGGLGPENAGQAFQDCGPDGVDCNSGLERAPGIKDARKLRRLMDSLRTGALA